MNSLVRYFWNSKIQENVIIKSRNYGVRAVYTAQNSAFCSVLRMQNWFELFFFPDWYCIYCSTLIYSHVLGSIPKTGESYFFRVIGTFYMKTLV